MSRLWFRYFCRHLQQSIMCPHTTIYVSSYYYMCLVCGSEQVYLARTNAMLDGTPVNEAVMAKRRRGGGSIFETDKLDAQLQERNAAEDLAFLKVLRY